MTFVPMNQLGAHKGGRKNVSLVLLFNLFIFNFNPVTKHTGIIRVIDGGGSRRPGPMATRSPTTRRIVGQFVFCSFRRKKSASVTLVHLETPRVRAPVLPER